MVTIKIKPLLPSLRERKRYLVYEIIADKPVEDFTLLKNQLWDDCCEFLGVYGMSKTGLYIMPEKFNKKAQRGILCMNHTATSLIKAALLFVRQIDKLPVILRSVYVSGTLKKASIYLTRGD